MTKKLFVWNNPYLALGYQAKIDLISGKAFYKTNTNNNIGARGSFIDFHDFYESFFLLPQERINKFIPKLSVLETWNPIYEIENRGIIIDGFQWSIKLFNDTEKEIRGCQCKPEGFDTFIYEIEVLLQKDFGSQRTQ